MDPAKPPHLIHTDLFGGRGQVLVWSLLAGPAEPFTAVLSCELAPGGEVGSHVQQEYPEIVIGIGGDGIAVVDGTELPLRDGDVVSLPCGSVLSIVNGSATEPLRYLIVKARA
jgi:uncharacterized cupin superfamily protein